MRCSPLRSLVALWMVALTVRSTCLIGSAPSAGASLRGNPQRVAREAVRLDVPMKESELAQPQEEPDRTTYLVGFVPFAEQLNGRIAMIFFFVLIFQEYAAGKGLFEQISELFGSG
eukprot:CAMPEP_0114638526 /NCGR_PEP_ID=MMETSP0191-20121206/667_1 /TAXON_ID=126664 /ORGANISM="Sorites sp." /LENGTH=115 /DNA_ID=CAMNT_0001850299 /DNA_START=66 /DNA_END=413 /DNA_ORIENTATION=+